MGQPLYHSEGCHHAVLPIHNTSPKALIPGKYCALHEMYRAHYHTMWQCALCFLHQRKAGSNTNYLTLLQQRKKHIIMHIHVHIHVHTHTSEHAHTHRYTHARTHAHTHTDSQTHTRTHTHAHAHTHRHTCTHTRTHIHRHTCTHTHTHTHTRAHTDTHTRTHTRTHTHTHTYTDTQTYSLSCLKVFLFADESRHSLRTCIAFPCDLTYLVPVNRATYTTNDTSIPYKGQ